MWRYPLEDGDSTSGHILVNDDYRFSVCYLPSTALQNQVAAGDDLPHLCGNLGWITLVQVTRAAVPS